MVKNPDDPAKSTPKKMYYLACGVCRWTTRDVAIPDKPVGKCWSRFYGMYIVSTNTYIIHTLYSTCKV